MDPALKIWDYLQSETPEIFEGNYTRIKFLVSHFKKGDRVLNIGTGNGWLEDICLKRGIDAYALDPSEKTILMLRQKLGLGEKAAVGYAKSIPFGDGFFDGVVMTEVIEHLPRETMEQTYTEVKRVLRPGRMFLGTVPNDEDLGADMVICPKCGEKFSRWGHQQTFTIEKFTEQLSPYFTVRKMEHKFFIPWNMLNWKGKVDSAIKYLVFKAGFLDRRRLNIFFLCSKPV